MTKVIKGGCKCGQVRFELSEPPIVGMICHCGGCFKRTGPYGGGMFARTDTLTITGEIIEGHDVGGTGMAIHTWHCAECKSAVGCRAEAVPMLRIIMAQALDDQADFVPRFHNWVSGKPSWVTIADDLPQFPNSVDWDALGGRPDFGTPRVQAPSTQP